jgi:hypothetical protein
VGDYEMTFTPPEGFVLPGPETIQVTVHAGQTVTPPIFGVAPAARGALLLPLLQKN